VAGQHGPLSWWKLVALGGLATVMLVMLLGQSRVFYPCRAMGCSGLGRARFIIAFARRISSFHCGRYFRCDLATVIPLNVLDEMTSVGTLLAFILVSAGVWVMRRTHPELIRPFRTPLVPLVPILSILFSGGAHRFFYLRQPKFGWLVWLVIGLAITLAMERKHSKVQQALQSEAGFEECVLGIFSLAV